MKGYQVLYFVAGMLMGLGTLGVSFHPEQASAACFIGVALSLFCAIATDNS